MFRVLGFRFQDALCIVQGIQGVETMAQGTECKALVVEDA